MTLELTLPAQLQRFIEEELASGRYVDATEVVRDAIRRLMDARPTSHARPSVTGMDNGSVVEPGLLAPPAAAVAPVAPVPVAPMIAQPSQTAMADPAGAESSRGSESRLAEVTQRLEALRAALRPVVDEFSARDARGAG